eukprot:XP_003389680.1 PREDICTED: probable sulfate/thiosulfate import ATP-binding protein CysA [Amphimedon queenslandica]
MSSSPPSSTPCKESASEIPAEDSSDHRSGASSDSPPGFGAILSLVGVSKSYGSLKALDAVDLEVGGGEFVGLLGPNGAGKSTLFQILSGLFVADAGQVRALGYDLRRDPVKALAGIGTVFQQPTLDLDLSAYANLRFGALLHGMPARRRMDRIEAEISRLGLGEQADMPVRRLSGGNRRRVELARALVHEPQLLLMDEATVGLDPASRRGLIEDVRALCAERGVGALWATHLVDEVEHAHKVVILHRGRVLIAGSPSAIASHAGAKSIDAAFMAMTGAAS